jgi:hypothetical protein
MDFFLLVHVYFMTFSFSLFQLGLATHVILSETAFMTLATPVLYLPRNLNN